MKPGSDSIWRHRRAMWNKFGEMQQMMKKMGKMGGGLPGMLRR
jgi:hypothetical protein